MFHCCLARCDAVGRLYFAGQPCKMCGAVPAVLLAHRWSPAAKFASQPCRQIQQVLVALKDKGASFIGSSNWIGAIELSYILDEYLGVTSKVGSGPRACRCYCGMLVLARVARC
eukprot:GHRQ01028246.1.p1 GENE.GHRQ01028246.1~~GHRQ01028246.1.p1  ORF type:complete len:114 (-),score=11.56 GHRQ01028246.1:797-1138(-)